MVAEGFGFALNATPLLIPLYVTPFIIALNGPVPLLVTIVNFPSAPLQIVPPLANEDTWGCALTITEYVAVAWQPALDTVIVNVTVLPASFAPAV